MAYSELVKNFEKIRRYMREFYVYGFKSREEYTEKSARSYDDERRRLESWLGEHMRFVRTPEGKTVFISIDSRVSAHNPLYAAMKAKSFTDGDITLHFILFDILHAPDVTATLPEILERIDGYLASFDEPMVFDESTVRKKLKEYTALGLIVTEKVGRRVTYRRAAAGVVDGLEDVLNFYSEVAPCGVIGSFLLDKCEPHDGRFAFKHHYITAAIDSDVLATLFTAMREKREVTLNNISRRTNAVQQLQVVPLRVFISVQNGRQHLLAFQPQYGAFRSYRIDYLSDVRLGDVSSHFDEWRRGLDEQQKTMWGVNTPWRDGATEHVEFTVTVAEDEWYIVQRLEREKRIGRVEKVDESTYRFVADVCDTSEMIPWIRTFLCRITDLKFSNTALQEQFLEDVREMYRMYGIEEVGS